MKRLTLRILPLVATIGFCLVSCQYQDMKKLKNELRETDVAFSDMAKEKGVKAAFMEFVADDGVLLRDYSRPVVGKNALQQLFADKDYSKVTFTWEPIYVDIARSGELGYTYGIYQMQKEEESASGTYVTIWKRNTEGKWKFVLDSGNQGLEEKEKKEEMQE